MTPTGHESDMIASARSALAAPAGHDDATLRLHARALWKNGNPADRDLARAFVNFGLKPDSPAAWRD